MNEPTPRHTSSRRRIRRYGPSIHAPTDKSPDERADTARPATEIDLRRRSRSTPRFRIDDLDRLMNAWADGYQSRYPATLVRPADGGEVGDGA